MSMSLHVAAIKPADDTYKKMLAIWQSCEAAGIDIPRPVLDFFNGEKPEPSGVLQHLDGWKQMHPCCTEWRSNGSNGFEIDISKLPPGTKILRFYASW